MCRFLVLTALLCVSLVAGRTITLKNQCSQTLWASSSALSSGNNGWVINQGQSTSFTVPDTWAGGRVWARTGCSTNSQGHLVCETGDCPLPASYYSSSNNGLYCREVGGVPPASLIEFTLISGGVDTYDLSLVDGYNLPLQVTPTGSYTTVNNPDLGKYNCGAPVINTMSESQCPQDMRKYNSANQYVACWSPCKASYDSVEKAKSADVRAWANIQSLVCCTCGNNGLKCGETGCEHGCSWNSNWPVNQRCYLTDWPQKAQDVVNTFKAISPDAYSWQFDDDKSTYQCRNGNYDITFCPNTPTPCTGGGITSLSGKDLPGADITHAASSSMADCITQCQHTTSCTAVTLSAGICYFKSAASTPTDCASCTSASCIPQAVAGSCAASGSMTQAPGTDLYGGDLTSAPASTIEACIALCAANANCKAVTLSNNVCYLKSAAALSDQRTCSGCVSAYCSGVATCRSMAQLSAVDLYGSDLSHAAAASIDVCISQCQGNAACKAATWASNVCYLKTEAALSNQKSCAGCVSVYCAGVDHCPAASWTSAANTDLNGGDITSAAGATINDCQTACSANSGCVAATLYQGVCYLKGGAALANQKSCAGCTSGKCGGNLVASSTVTTAAVDGQSMYADGGATAADQAPAAAAAAVEPPAEVIAHGQNVNVDA